jgi:cytoskeletal protein CcmA (bactofilin family)
MAGSVIGSGLVVEGELSSDDAVTIEGTLRGTLVSASALNIEADAVVEADVSASAVSVAGQLTGNVRAADRVDIQSGGRLLGDVKTGRLTIADGSVFRGNVEMDA